MDSSNPIDAVVASQGADTQVNENDDALSAGALYGRRASTCNGLTWGYYGGRFNSALIAHGTLALTASSTNYIVAAKSNGAVSVSTSNTNWNDTGNYIRLYLVPAGTSTATSWEDHRQAIVPPGAGTGDVVGPGSSTDNALARFDGTGGDQLQDSGVLLTDDDELSGYHGNINRQTGTSYTLQASDTGKIVKLTNAASITLACPDSLAPGWCCTVLQGGAGVITFDPTGGATVDNRQSHTSSGGLFAVCVLFVDTNTGSNAAYILGGDTAP